MCYFLFHRESSVTIAPLHNTSFEPYALRTRANFNFWSADNDITVGKLKRTTQRYNTKLEINTIPYDNSKSFDEGYLCVLQVIPTCTPFVCLISV